MSFGISMKTTIKILLLFCLLLAQKAYTQEIVQITEEESYFPISFENALILEDKEHQITLETVEALPDDKFTKISSSNYINFGVTTSAYWLKFKILNKTNGRIFLRTLNPGLDTAHLFIYTDHKLLMNKSVLNTQPEFSLPSSPFALPSYTDTLTCYIRVFSKVPCVVPMYILPEKHMAQVIFIQAIPDLLFFGAVLIMVLYNLFIGLITRNRVYLYYILYSFTVGLTTFYFKSYPIVLLGQYHGLINDNFAVIASVAPICLSLFTADFLQTKERYQLGHRLLLVSIGFHTIAIVVFLCGFVNLNVALFQPFTLFTNLSVIITSLRLYKSYRPARIFFVAFLSYVIFSSGVILIFLNIIPVTLFVFYFLHIGVSIEITLFSIALADRINLYRKEKEDAQFEILKITQEQNIILEAKVEERTLQLKEANEELNQNNEELTVLNSLLGEKNIEIEDKNTNMIASLEYAETIQRTILPTEQYFQSILPESFVFFQPRDIVSGDFYFIHEKNNQILIVAADCTGHGVPGALLSMTGVELIEKIIDQSTDLHPDLILNELHLSIRRVLKQETGKNKDGMDISLVCWDKDKKIMQYAGAKNPMIYIQDKQLKEIKANRFSVGGEQKEGERIFTKHIFSVEHPTTLYLFSDGFQDQFGGLQNKKFMIGQMKDMLLEIHTLPMSEQKEILSQRFRDWIQTGNEQQIDDVLVMGVKLE